MTLGWSSLWSWTLAPVFIGIILLLRAVASDMGEDQELEKLWSSVLLAVCAWQLLLILRLTLSLNGDGPVPPPIAWLSYAVLSYPTRLLPLLLLIALGIHQFLARSTSKCPRFKESSKWPPPS